MSVGGEYIGFNPLELLEPNSMKLGKAQATAHMTWT
jgi:hypothetical protein